MMFRAVAAFGLLFALNVSASETITRGDNLSVDVTNDGRLLIDLAGNAWIVPLNGGEAVAAQDANATAYRPRWSPDSSAFLYSSVVDGLAGIWLHDRTTGSSRPISSGDYLDLDPDWHPDGERIVYSSDRGRTGFDLWETDLPTGLHWRLSSRDGDESDPAWSANGRNLVYVHRDNDTWSLVLRMHGEPEEILVSGNARLSGPSWRPDGSLITFWRETDDGIVLDMVILSSPRLVRRYMDGEDYETTPVSWLDKHRMFYSANGVIRQRLFNSWSSRTIPFRVTLEAEPAAVVERVRRSLPRVGEPRGRLVIHAERMFDGIGGGYRDDQDILIEGGRITGVEDHAEREDAIVINMGDLTILPGFVDVMAVLPVETDPAMGPLILTTGVTTIVAEHEEAEHLNTIWSGKELPGPRVLAATDWEVAAYSGLADSQTPGLEALLQSRQGGLIDVQESVARRFSEPPAIDAGVTDVVIGSAPNGLPAGLGLHAELLALQAAGLVPEQVLRAAGVNAAAALGVDPVLGRIATGAVADLVFVDGDPLARPADALRVVAVVRNGRFFSTAGLIDRSRPVNNVE